MTYKQERLLIKLIIAIAEKLNIPVAVSKSDDIKREKNN